jgi:hypothetical protein
MKGAMFVFGTNERTVKTEAKKQLEYWFENGNSRLVEQENSRTF